jgi:hypothetical protein
MYSFLFSIGIKAFQGCRRIADVLGGHRAITVRAERAELRGRFLESSTHATIHPLPGYLRHPTQANNSDGIDAYLMDFVTRLLNSAMPPYVRFRRRRKEFQIKTWVPVAPP